MAPFPPLLLVDNQLDTISLYPAATLSTTSELTGREGYRVADARRDRSWWQPTGDGPSGAGGGNSIVVDLGVGNTGAPDYLWIDRGHNLTGKTVLIESSVDNFATPVTVASAVVPAAGTLGGDPTTGFTVTEEGAMYYLFAAGTARRYLRVRVQYVAAFVPVITGLMLGKRSQLLTPWGWSNVKDEDAMSRTEIQEMSRSGYLGTDKRYAWRTIVIGLDKIGATDYDATIRTLRRQLFELDQPFVATMDYGTRPERSWLYRWDGTQYSSGANRVLRSVQLRGREIGPLLR